eukprot:2079657-Prymnesium_polylepis.2
MDSGAFRHTLVDEHTAVGKAGMRSETRVRGPKMALRRGADQLEGGDHGGLEQKPFSPVSVERTWTLHQRAYVARCRISLPTVDNSALGYYK